MGLCRKKKQGLAFLGSRSWVEDSFWPLACVPTRSQPDCGPRFLVLSPCLPAGWGDVAVPERLAVILVFCFVFLHMSVIQPDKPGLCAVMVGHH